MKFWRWGSPSISDSSSKVYIFWSRRNQNQKINITDSLEGIARSYLIWHLSKNPFKNRFFATSYSYPQRGVHTHNRDCECPAPRIRVACSKEAVLKGVLEGCLIKMTPAYVILFGVIYSLPLRYMVTYVTCANCNCAKLLYYRTLLCAYFWEPN